jgi:hypothetical protein
MIPETLEASIIERGRRDVQAMVEDILSPETGEVCVFNEHSLPYQSSSIGFTSLPYDAPVAIPLDSATYKGYSTQKVSAVVSFVSALPILIYTVTLIILVGYVRVIYDIGSRILASFGY